MVRWCGSLCGSYSFDQLFSYVSMQPISLGCRVVVPFGRSNTKRVGIVLSCEPQTATDLQLKTVLSVVDEHSLLSPEMLELVFWLKEMTFCTYYDAVRTILPAGMQVQLVETVSLAKALPEVPLTEAEQQQLFFLKNARTKREFQRILSDMDAEGKKVLESLLKKGFLIRRETVREKTHGQTGIRMLRLAEAAEEAPRITQTQQKLVKLLQEVGTLSEKEACYLSGVSASVAKKLVQSGVAESYVVKSNTDLYAGQKQTGTPEDVVLFSGAAGCVSVSGGCPWKGDALFFAAWRHRQRKDQRIYPLDSHGTSAWRTGDPSGAGNCAHTADGGALLPAVWRGGRCGAQRTLFGTAQRHLAQNRRRRSTHHYRDSERSFCAGAEAGASGGG